MKGPYSNGTDRTWKRIKRLPAILGLASTLTACALTETKPSPEPPPSEPQPVLPCSTLPAKDLERGALELLDAGDKTAARDQLECALELSPGSTQATLLIEQLDADPVATLGRRHFMYTVKSNDTLSRIAQQYLGSRLKFVILARYNDIEVPANLVAGTAIKIPGTKPPEPAPTEPTEPTDRADAEELRAQASTMEQQGELETAYELMTRAVEEDPSLENADVDLARIKKGLIAKLEGDAYDRELYGEPEQAAEIWRKILEIDPTNIPAQLALKRLTE